MDDFELLLLFFKYTSLIYNVFKAIFKCAKKSSRQLKRQNRRNRASNSRRYRRR